MFNINEVIGCIVKYDYYMSMNDEQESDLTNLKLQKLLYYLQGHYLAEFKQKLFKDNLEAWTYGPVVPHVYHSLKKYGSTPITSTIIDDKQYNGSVIMKRRDLEDFLYGVIKHYNEFSAWKLRDMTHNEIPWIEAEKNDVISIDLMENFFSQDSIKEKILLEYYKPTEETIKALEESKDIELARHASVEELYKDLGI